jgi:hypothetical protein
MRVLLLTDFYPPTVGGIERHVQLLGRCLVDRGHRVAVASIAAGGPGADGPTPAELDAGV